MKRTSIAHLLFMLLGLLAAWQCLTACSPSEIKPSDRAENEQGNGKVKVLSTISMIDDLVRQIGGEFVERTVLIKGELDPHSYRMVKGDDDKLFRAQLIFYNGLGLEHGPSFQKHLYQNSKAVGIGEKILEESPEKILYFNGSVDPHIWMDISLWSQAVPSIVNALCQTDPTHAENYRSNGDNVQASLREAHREIRDILQALPSSSRYLVTSHDAFNYFARAYLAAAEEQSGNAWQKRVAAPEGLSPESQISVKDIRIIIDFLSQYKIPVLFPETNVSKDSINKIVQAGKDRGLSICAANESLYADAMGGPGSSGDTYLKMMKHNASTIARFLSQEPKQKADGR